MQRYISKQNMCWAEYSVPFYMMKDVNTAIQSGRIAGYWISAIILACLGIFSLMWLVEDEPMLTIITPLLGIIPFLFVPGLVGMCYKRRWEEEQYIKNWYKEQGFDNKEAIVQREAMVRTNKKATAITNGAAMIASSNS